MTDNAKSPILSKNVSSSIGLEPSLRFPGFEGDWLNKNLSNITNYGKCRKSTKKKNYVSTENMLQNYGGINRYLSNEDVSGIAFEEHDILVANIRPYLKKIWYAEFSGAASTDVLVLKPNGIYSGFLKHIISNDSFINYVMSAVKGSKMPRGDKSHIMQYTFGVPVLLEQQKIADFLSLVDERIEKQRQLVEVLKRYKRGALIKIFDGCENWTKFLAKDVAKISTGSSNTQDSVSNGIYPFFIRSANVSQSNKFVYDGEAVLTIGDGQIGKVFHYINGKFDCHQRVYMITKFNNVSGRYFYHFFSTFFYNRAMKMSARNTVDSVRMEMIADMPIYVPDRQAEVRIVNFLDGIDSQIQQQEHVLEYLNIYKNGLLQQMFV